MSNPKCIEVEGELKSLIKVWLTVLASLTYSYFLSSKIPKGILRFLSLCPVLYLFTILPLQLSTVLSTGITAFFITWLTNFKLLLFSFDLGPLSSNSKSLFLFLSFACLPIRIIHKQTYPIDQNSSKSNLFQKQTYPIDQNPSKLKLFILPIKTLLLGLLLIGLNDQNHYHNHGVIIMGLYCSLVYLLLDVVLGLCNILINAIIGIELELPSNEPYLSTSLRDFWGRRWNLMVTYIPRLSVYNPMTTLFSSKTRLGPQWAPLLGAFATFLVSGLMHELLFYYVTRAPPTWEVTCFFLLHGACVVVEFGVMKLLGHKYKWRVHWVLSGPITVVFVVVTASWLFFPPLLRRGADRRSLEEFSNLVDCIVGKFKSHLN